ncbi:MAG: alpha-1,4-glucan--maltose-1-phosphate maltosyltransferase [Steroidobacteraceae bacterium]
MSPSDATPPRVVIENVTPSIDHGRFPVKRVAGETVAVEADVFTDGHDSVCARLLHRAVSPPASTSASTPGSASTWQSIPMTPLGNDRFAAEFVVEGLGSHEYTIAAWVDVVETWRRGLAAKHEAGIDVAVELLRGAELVRAAASRALACAAAVSRTADGLIDMVAAPDATADAADADARRLSDWARALAATRVSITERVARAQSEDLLELARRYPEPQQVLRHELPLPVSADRLRARYSTWYELFPRSAGPAPGVHGTFSDCEARLADIAAMGFDVLYLPPIHPIGRTNRKGRNGAVRASAGDPGSPWAIGGQAGGHKSVHPQLGTLAGLRRLTERAAAHGLEIALDLAFQCSPDHPYVHEHPEWFRHRPDGTVQHAENPPKQYEDIYPFDFQTPAWRELWAELASVVEHWIGAGVHIFRVDNPHTKPFAFWEWLIARIERRFPGVIFLAEAFTRPKVMHRLAKLGFTQSYTYFAWRNARHEITEYFRELGTPPVSDYFRASLWPNTPDILTEYLQSGGRAAFMARLALAATLGASYGIYGPAFERMEHIPREPGSEEYRDSEKYELRGWGAEPPGSLCGFVAQVNRIRRENAALQSDRHLVFHGLDNEALIAYSKTTADRANVILAVVNLDPLYAQSGWTELDLGALGLAPDQPFDAHDLLTDAHYPWRGSRNFVRLDPSMPAHVLRLRSDAAPSPGISA